MKKPTEKDLKRFLALMEKWGRKIGREGWAVAGEVCDCDKHKTSYAHLQSHATSHIATVKLHDASVVEATALHEQLHLELEPMGDLVHGMRVHATTEEHLQVAFNWYQYYEDCFINKMTEVLLGMDKEIRSLKRKIRKLEKGGKR